MTSKNHWYKVENLGKYKSFFRQWSISPFPILKKLPNMSLREKCLIIRCFFWSIFLRIRTEYRKIRTRKNSVSQHFSRSVSHPTQPNRRFKQSVNVTYLSRANTFRYNADSIRPYPAFIYLFKINDRGTRNMCEICSKLTIKKLERRHWCRSGPFIVNFKHISHLLLVFLLLTLTK